MHGGVGKHDTLLVLFGRVPIQSFFFFVISSTKTKKSMYVIAYSLSG